MAGERPQTSTVYEFQADARAAATRTAQAASDVTRQSAEAAQRGAAAVVEMARQTGDVAGEAMRRSVRVAAESQRQFAQDAAEQLTDVSRTITQAVQGITEGLCTLMVLPNAACGSLQDFQQGITGLFEGIARTNVRATQELFRFYSPSAVIELQQRLVREYLDTVVESSTILARAAQRTADQMLRPLEQQVQQRRQILQDEQRHRHAAE